MTSQADTHHCDKKNEKVYHFYNDHYLVIKKIGKVAYQIDLAPIQHYPSCLHVSQLKLARNQIMYHVLYYHNTGGMCLININPLAVLGVKLARETFYEDFDALIHWERQTTKDPSDINSLCRGGINRIDRIDRP